MWNPKNPLHCEIMQEIIKAKGQCPSFNHYRDGILAFSDKKRAAILEGKKTATEIIKLLRNKLALQLVLDYTIIDTICEEILRSEEKAAIAKAVAIMDELAYDRALGFVPDPDLEQYSMPEADYARGLSNN